ncbi:MAG: MMPL family transporter [Propionibacteriaceae bacterium]|jgi:RND superfamily putative drug exporter|nr:MMPL family transporter [Propionibacteriaceae bacterium]
MFTKLGNGLTKHPWVFIIFWVVVLGAATSGAFYGYGQGGLFDRMESSDAMATGTESYTVQELTSTADGGVSLMVVVDGVPAAELATDQAKAGAVVMALQDVATNPWVAHVTSPFSFDNPQDQQALAFYSSAGTGFALTLTLKPEYSDLSSSALHTAQTSLDDTVAGLETALTKVFPDAKAYELSNTKVGDAINELVREDLVRSESIGLPVALLLMIIVFGGVIAAGLPLLGALVSIAIGLGAVWALTFYRGVDSFNLNVISIIGVALSIDYGLLVVSRYREELARILDSDDVPTVVPGAKHSEVDVKAVVAQAVRTTVATAGRTVSFSALTIACALAGLFAMEAAIFKTIAFGAVVVTVLAVATAVTLVPAVIVLLGNILVRPALPARIPGLKQLTKVLSDSSSDHGVFSRLAHFVHRHPWLIMAVVAAILATMAWPIRDIKARSAFSDYLPADAAVTKATNIVQEQYPALRTQSIVVVADTTADKALPLYQYLSTVPNVDFVMPPQPLASDPTRSVLSAHLAVADQVGDEVTDLVVALREGTDFDPGYPILVGGQAAQQHDLVEMIWEDAPLAGAIILIAVLVLLFLMTGSLIVPIKALIINSLSLLASLGATVFIFEHGLLGMPKVLGLETFIIVCSISFGFGLAMDYEVFLLARIKEYWDAGLSNDEAVERGLQRSGRIITSAAAIIVAVFVGFTFGDMVAIKEIGVALAITVLTDATLVRMLLVPATMTVLGRWNWWAPKPLAWVYEKFKIIH